MNIILRSGWNARQPKNGPTYVSPSKREYFVVHHSGAPATQTVRAIQDWCMDGRGFSDIDYNHLVRATDGTIYEGRGWDVVGAHTTNFNTSGVGICVIGNNEISDAAKRSVRWLYEQYNARCGKTLKVRGHRQLATTGTTCPGDTIYAWLQVGMSAPAAPTQEDTVSQADVIAALRSKEGREALAYAVLGYDPGRDDKGNTWPGVPDATYAQGPNSNGTVAPGTALGSILARQQVQGEVLKKIEETLAELAARLRS